MSGFDDIVDRAIDYTQQVLHRLPAYRAAAIDSLRKLREALARQDPDDPALGRLDEYIAGLEGDASAP